MASALVFLADGFEEIEAVSVIDILRRGGVKVVTASIGESLDVHGAHSIDIKADAFLKDLDDQTFEAVILPGGGDGTKNLGQSSLVIDRLLRQKEEGGYICAICAAPIVLCEAGVLEQGQHITCYPTCVMDLDRPSAAVPAVVDDNVITGQAPGSAMLFGLVVLGALTNEAIMQKTARGLVTDVLES